MILGKSRHKLVLFTDDGMRLTELKQVERFSYWRAVNDVGGFEMILKPDFDDSLIDIDHLVYFWRKPRGGEERCMCVGFCRDWGWFENEDGQDRFKIEGVDQNDLLDRRIIAYYADTADRSTITNFSDTILQVIVYYNMGPGAPVDEAGRPRAFDTTRFDTMAYTFNGFWMTRSFAWRFVLPILQEIAQASADQGYPLYFDVIPSSEPAKFEFQTFIPYLGVDRSATSKVPIIFSKQEGNLGKPSWEENWFEERNYVYGGGQGEDDDRMIDPEDDPPRMHRSIWNRRECFQDAREEETLQGVANKAYERMQRERPFVRFEGDLLDTPRTRFGKNFDYGDLITARYKNKQFDTMVDAFKITVDESGKEELELRTEVQYYYGWQ